MATNIDHFIDGEIFKGQGRRTADVFNPATGEVTKQVSLASAEDVKKAIQSAAAALPGWSATPPAKRAAGDVQASRSFDHSNHDAIAKAISAEHGKTVDDAKGEVARGLEVVEFVCGIPHLLKGEYSDNVAGVADSVGMRQPVGVCAGITPFNFPAMVPMWMFPVALACGNTFVLKPSERDPSAPMRAGTS